MQPASRAALFLSLAAGSFVLDGATKLTPHGTEAANYSAFPLWLLVTVALCLFALAISHSTLVAAGTGLMLGGLAGNGIQLAVEGYATDWIQVGGWLTNIADISGAVGLLCCCVGYLRPLVRDARTPPYLSDDSDGGLS